MLCVVSAAAVFAATTNPSDLLRGLVQQARVPYKLAFTALAGYRMLPLLAVEYDIIRAAHRIRGVPEGSGFTGKLTRLKSYGVPLLAGAVRRAEKMALALDARAFGAYPTRTNCHPRAFRPVDWAFLASGLAILFLITWQQGY
jgi:energy-coupling factor transport system permease protein